MLQPVCYPGVLEQEPLIHSVILEHHHESRPYCWFDQLQLEGEVAYGPQMRTSFLQFRSQTVSSQPLLPEPSSAGLGVEFRGIDTRVQRVIEVEGQELIRFSVQQEEGNKVLRGCDGCIFRS